MKKVSLKKILNNALGLPVTSFCIIMGYFNIKVFFILRKFMRIVKRSDLVYLNNNGHNNEGVIAELKPNEVENSFTGIDSSSASMVHGITRAMIQQFIQESKKETNLLMMVMPLNLPASLRFFLQFSCF